MSITVGDLIFLLAYYKQKTQDLEQQLAISRIATEEYRKSFVKTYSELGLLKNKIKER